jgi:hypothetical protein
VTVRRKIRLPIFLVGACALVAVAGCSSSAKPNSSSSSGTTTVASGKQPVCAARTNLKESVAALATPSLLTGGKAAIQSALSTVKDNLAAVASSADAAYQPQVDAVQSAVNDFTMALSEFGNGDVTQNVQALGTAITNVGSTSDALVTKLQASCPSS